jgi:hypothetical protein
MFVAAAALAAMAEDEFLAICSQVSHLLRLFTRLRIKPVNHRAGRHLHREMPAVPSGFPLACSRLPRLGHSLRFVKESAQAVRVRIDLEDHVAAAPAVAAVGASLGNILVPDPMDHAIASVTRLRINLQVINKHRWSVWR